MGAGFRALLVKLLGRIGMLVLDPLDPQLRNVGAPFMAEALAAAPDLKTALLDRNKELAAAGYHAQVNVEENSSLFFLLENGERINLRKKDAEFAALERPGRRHIAQCAAASGVAGLPAPDRRLRGRAGRARVSGAIAGDLRPAAGAHAGGGVAGELHVAGRARRETHWSIRPDDPGHAGSGRVAEGTDRARFDPGSGGELVRRNVGRGHAAGWTGSARGSKASIRLWRRRWPRAARRSCISSKSCARRPNARRCAGMRARPKNPAI